MNKYIIKFWGVLDFAYFIYYIIGYIIADRIPFVWDIQTGQKTALSFGNKLPLYSVLVSITLMATLPVSGWILFKERLRLRWIVYFQTPFRIFSVMPSIFFMLWIFPTLTKPFQIAWITLLLIIAIEVFKILTVFKRHKQIIDWST